VYSVAVSEDGQWLFTGSQDYAVLAQWRVSDGTRVRIMEGSLSWLFSNDFQRPLEHSYYPRTFKGLLI
jgi:WD40 repeat protein